MPNNSSTNNNNSNNNNSTSNGNNRNSRNNSSSSSRASNNGSYQAKQQDHSGDNSYSRESTTSPNNSNADGSGSNGEFIGFGVEVELQDGKKITGKIYKYNGKTLILNDVRFGDGGTAPLFKVKSNRLKDLKVTAVPENRKRNNQNNTGSNSNNNTNSVNNSNNNNSRDKNRDNNQYNSKNGGNFWDDDVKKIKQGKDEFDFQSNLEMFDKSKVFEKLKMQDQMDPNQRLVSVNKLNPSASSSNAGDKKVNYGNDENVLQNVQEDCWDSISSPVLVTPKDAETSSVSSPLSKKLEAKLSLVSGNNNNKRDDTGSATGKKDKQVKKLNEKDFFPITNAINITHLLKKTNSNQKNEDTPVKNKNANNDKNKNKKNTGNSQSDSDDNDDDDDNDFMDSSEVLAKLQQVLDANNRNMNNNIRKQSFSMTSPVNNKKFITINSKNNNNVLIPPATPVQLLEIDRFTTDEYLFSYKKQVEQCSLSLSQFIKNKKFFGDIRLNNKGHNTPPLIVILASNDTKIGLLSVVLGRVLSQTSHIRVLMYLFETDGKKRRSRRNGYSRRGNGGKSRKSYYDDEDEDDVDDDDDDLDDERDEDDHDTNSSSDDGYNGSSDQKNRRRRIRNGDDISVEFKEQIQLFKKFGGKVISNFHTFTNILNRLNSPVELILDGLQGYDFNIDDLLSNTSTSSLKNTTNTNSNNTNSNNNGSNLGVSTTREEDELISIMDWCNDKQQERCSVWSLEIPSGVDPNTGEPDFITSIDPDCIVSFGLPLNVLLYLHSPLDPVDDHYYNSKNTKNLESKTSHHTKQHYLVNMGIPSGVYQLKSTLRKFYSPLDEVFAVENVVELKVQE